MRRKHAEIPPDIDSAVAEGVVEVATWASVVQVGLPHPLDVTPVEGLDTLERRTLAKAERYKAIYAKL